MRAPPSSFNNRRIAATMLPLSARPAADAEEQSSWQHPVPIPVPHSPTTHQHAIHTREWAPAHPPKSPVSKTITTGGAHRPALSLRLGRQELQPSPSSQDRHLHRVWRRVDRAAISFIAGGFIRGWTATFRPPSPSSSQRFSWLITVTRWTGSGYDRILCCEKVGVWAWASQRGTEMSKPSARVQGHIELPDWCSPL